MDLWNQGATELRNLLIYINTVFKAKKEVVYEGTCKW